MTQFNRVFVDNALFIAYYERDLYKDHNKDPSSQALLPQYFVELYQSFNKVIRDVALTENVLLIDLDKHLAAKAQQYLYDSVHLNTNGSEFVGEIITTELIKEYPNSFKRIEGNR